MKMNIKPIFILRLIEAFVVQKIRLLELLMLQPGHYFFKLLFEEVLT